MVLKKGGFTLIELSLYIALFMIFSLGAFYMLADTMHGVKKTQRIFAEMLTNMLVRDIVRRDVMSASMQPAHWDEKNGVFKKITCDEKGKVKEVDICFFVKNNKLYRIEGVYNFLTGRWIKRFTSLVGGNFKHVSVASAGNKKTGMIALVLYTYQEVHGHTQADSIALRNRVLS